VRVAFRGELSSKAVCLNYRWNDNIAYTQYSESDLMVSGQGSVTSVALVALNFRIQVPGTGPDVQVYICERLYLNTPFQE
jgi:hypothetical protein